MCCVDENSESFYRQKISMQEHYQMFGTHTFLAAGHPKYCSEDNEGSTFVCLVQIEDEHVLESRCYLNK